MNILMFGATGQVAREVMRRAPAAGTAGCGAAAGSEGVNMGSRFIQPDREPGKIVGLRDERAGDTVFAMAGLRP
ncbi:MAG: hypothetical protein ACRCS3_11990 [Paracoccaceae bacterium]